MVVDISNNIDSESFKDPSEGDDWVAGAFDYQLLLSDVDDEIIFNICEWLADNCSNNFVVVRKTSELIAGGSTNNKMKWERRKKRGRDKFDREQIDVMVRLDRDDIVAFRMVWIL